MLPLHQRPMLQVFTAKCIARELANSFTLRFYGGCDNLARLRPQLLLFYLYSHPVHICHESYSNVALPLNIIVIVGFSSFNAFPLLVLIWGVLTHNRSTDLQTLAFLVCDHSVRLSLKTSATFDILRLATPRLFLTPRLSQSKIIGYYRQVYRF